MSEDGASRVAVFEAGDEEDATPDVYLPYKFVDFVQSQADWAYYTVPQEHCCKGLQENVRNLKVFFTFYFIILSAMLCVSVNLFLMFFFVTEKYMASRKGFGWLQ